MIEREHDRLSVSRQCRLVGLSRSTWYYRAVGESAETLALMQRIDGLYLEYPFYGSRQMMRHLAREGVRVGRHRVRRLMRLLGLEAIYRKPRVSGANPDHRVYPYLLRGLTIERPNQVWSADITYIPVQGGFLYLVAIMDWASRRVLAWRLSNTMDTSFCLAALAEALEGYGIPEIFNTDQGSQFTSIAFTGQLEATGPEQFALMRAATGTPGEEQIVLAKVFDRCGSRPGAGERGKQMIETVPYLQVGVEHDVTGGVIYQSHR